MSEASFRTAPVAPMLVAQTRANFLELWRVPAFSIVSIALPVIFFAFFALPNLKGHLDGVPAGAYFLVSYGAYGTMSVMLFSFGMRVAVERGQGTTVLLRATPLRPAVFMAARVLTAVAFSLCTLLVLFAFGILVGKVALPAPEWGNMVWRLLLGSIPFVAMGMAVGYVSGPNSAPAIINLIFLPMSFASGIFVPIQYLPSWIQQVAPYLPTYRYAQFAWSSVGVHTDPVGTILAWLGGWTLVFFLIAMRGYRQEEQRRFG
ncbi:MAG: ABC transporter permease [Candidatus Dormibacterales bacterium]